MNPYLLIAALVVFGGSLTATGVTAYRMGAEHEIAAQARQDAAVQAMTEAAAKAIARIEVKNVTIRQRLETEIREKPVYRDCRMDADGLRLVNEAITGTAPAGDRELPRDTTAN